MCGICGYFDMNKMGRIDPSILENMTKKLIHRGPDGINYYNNHQIGLGFTRLSIIGLEDGIQPMVNEDETILIICNGEIFNYIELREELMNRGHHLKTRTDVEVILHLYEEYGASLVEKLNGQFAFAIYDRNKESLLCVRDHVGIAPFFYTIVDGYFIFGSEIKAILQHPSVKREVDLVGLDQIFTFPGLIAPRTLFKNIHSLPGGHYLLINENSSVEACEYWDLRYPKLAEKIEYKDENYYIEKLDEIITRAVKLRLRADVDVGFYVSGGLDSSLIAAKISQIDTNRTRHSFSINFQDKSISENKYQKLLTEAVKSKHHEIVFDLPDIVSNLKSAVYHSEAALKETYNTASLELSKLVNKTKLKVVLTGEGADELLGGYVGYRFDKMRTLQKDEASKANLQESDIRRKLWGDEAFFYEKDYYAFTEEKKRLFSKSIRAQYEEMDCLNHFVINQERLTDVEQFNRRSYIDFKLRLPEHLLADHGDRMAFANSVEARYPFLDIDLINFIRSIPSELKVHNYCEKYILKKVAENYVAKQIVNRSKFTFVAQGSPHLLRQNNEYINHILSYEKIKSQGYFDPDVVEGLKKEYSDPNFKLNLPYDNDLLIIILTFGIFLEEFDMPNSSI